MNTKINPGIDLSTLYKIGYGLYLLTTNDGYKDNGLIINSVCQLTSDPVRIMVTINKANYSFETIMKQKKMIINCLSEKTPFSVFERFGFASGRNTDKFKDVYPIRTKNGLVIFPEYANSYISLEVIDFVDMQTHGMFICKVTEAKVLSIDKTMTYDYYQTNVKPKKQITKKGYVCKICGYVYEGEELPEDFICPICKHPSSDFERIN